MLNSSDKYLERLEALRRIFSSNNDPDITIGVMLPGASAAELDALDASMNERLECRLPQSYRVFLETCNGVGTQGSVLFGTDLITSRQPADWDKKGVVYASITWLSDPKKSQWIIIGENEFEVFAISRDDKQFAVLEGGTEEVVRTMDSMDALLCDCLDQMIEANAHNL